MRVLLVSLSVVVFSVVLYKYLRVDLIELSELDKCPYCYGTDLCGLLLDFDINLVDDSLNDIIANRFSVKNVFYAKLFGERIVLKKLAHSQELQQLDEAAKQCDSNNCNFTYEIIKTLTAKKQDVSNFKVCSNIGASVFVEEIISSTSTDDPQHIWTTLQVNAEPLLLQLLDSKWPVPEYVGACGRLTAQTYCGATLNSFQNANWLTRAYLAYQLLLAARNFTYDHDTFAFYLTDISPDNIAVDDDLTLTFIDLENVILKLKSEGSGYHHSKLYEVDEVLFVYSEDEICSSRVSDHNFYAVCELLLSPNAPWPMMKGGLLHSAPVKLATGLFESIDLCVKPKRNLTRLLIAESILGTLREILYTNGFNKTL